MAQTQDPSQVERATVLFAESWRGSMLSVLALASAVGAGCGPALDTPAGRCAAVARHHLDLEGGVALAGEPHDEPDGSVVIDYEGTGPMNLPVRGSAACTFRTGPEGTLVLEQAIVDGIPLPPDEIESIRRELPDGA